MVRPKKSKTVAAASEEGPSTSTAKNYTDSERQHLRQLVQKYKSIVENKKTDAVSNDRKKKTWEQITTEFNAQGSSNRTTASLQRCWENLKSRTKSDVRLISIALVSTNF
jgi:Myb/SANT-like DNA-binding protein